MNAFCSFCGKDAASVHRLIRGGGNQPSRSLPSVSICNECVELAAEILSEEKAALGGPLSAWKDFRVNRLRFEWSTFELRVGDEVRLMLQVRRQGEETPAAGVVCSPGETPGVEDAIEAVRVFRLADVERGSS